MARIDFSLRGWSAPSINTVTSLHLYLSNAVTSPVATRSGRRQACQKRSAALLSTLGWYVTEHQQSDVTTIYLQRRQSAVSNNHVLMCYQIDVSLFLRSFSACNSDKRWCLPVFVICTCGKNKLIISISFHRFDPSDAPSKPDNQQPDPLVFVASAVSYRTVFKKTCTAAVLGQVVTWGGWEKQPHQEWSQCHADV